MLHFDQLSYWEKESYLSKVDCLVIGSGIVGLTTAIQLKKLDPQKKVLIIERGYLPSGASTKNAGFACIGSASELLDDLNSDTPENVFSIVGQRWDGLNKLRKLAGDEAIEYMELGSHELFEHKERREAENCLDRLAYLNKELAQITGINTVYKEANSIIDDSGFSGFGKAISNSAEGQINTAKMLATLIQLANQLNIQLLNGIEVKSVQEQRVMTSHGTIDCKSIAICNNALARHFLDEEDIHPARAQVVVSSAISNLKFKGIFHFDKGYYYFRNVGNRILFGGGRNLDFKAEETDELNTSDYIINHLSHLLESKILPHSAFSIDHQWAGTMGLGSRKSPIVKSVSENIFCAVRLGGMGVAIGSLLGEQLATMILAED